MYWLYIVQDTINGPNLPVTLTRALTRSTYYYAEFTEESKSGFKFALPFGKRVAAWNARYVSLGQSDRTVLVTCVWSRQHGINRVLPMAMWSSLATTKISNNVLGLIYSRMRLKLDIVNQPKSAKDIPTLTRGTAKSSTNAQSSHTIMNDSWKSLSREWAARRNAEPIYMAKEQKKTPSMQTLGEVQVIGDSGALHNANRQQFRSASGLVFFSVPLDLIQQANGLYRQDLGGGGWESRLGWGWLPYLQRVMAIRHKPLRLPSASQTGDKSSTLKSTGSRTDY